MRLGRIWEPFCKPSRGRRVWKPARRAHWCLRVWKPPVPSSPSGISVREPLPSKFLSENLLCGQACVACNVYLKAKSPFSFLKIYLFIFREREGRDVREKHHPSAASRMPPTRELAHNPGMCPDWKLNQRPCRPQDNTQPTESHRSGQSQVFLKVRSSLYPADRPWKELEHT